MNELKKEPPINIMGAIVYCTAAEYELERLENLEKREFSHIRQAAAYIGRRKFKQPAGTVKAALNYSLAGVAKATEAITKRLESDQVLELRIKSIVRKVRKALKGEPSEKPSSDKGQRTEPAGGETEQAKTLLDEDAKVLFEKTWKILQEALNGAGVHSLSNLTLGDVRDAIIYVTWFNLPVTVQEQRTPLDAEHDAAFGRAAKLLVTNTDFAILVDLLAKKE